MYKCLGKFLRALFEHASMHLAAGLEWGTRMEESERERKRERGMGCWALQFNNSLLMDGVLLLHKSKTEKSASKS